MVTEKVVNILIYLSFHKLLNQMSWVRLLSNIIFNANVGLTLVLEFLQVTVQVPSSVFLHSL